MDSVLSSLVAEINANSQPIDRLSDQSELSTCPEHASPGDGGGLQGMTAEEREAAIQRAGAAMECAFIAFKEAEDQGDTKAASDHLNRAYRHLEQIQILHRGVKP